jgi:xanthine dehydrogenase molybdenum-binding subunit
MKRDGTVTALQGDWLVNTGSGSESAPLQIAVGCGELQLVLRCANWDLQTKLVTTNRSPSGIIRGYGGQELESAIMPVMAMAMEKVGLDPVQFFKKNVVKPGQSYIWRDGVEWVYRGTDYSAAIEKGMAAFDWNEKWRGWGKPSAVNGARRRGVGVGVHGNADVGEDETEAWVKITPDERAVLYCCVSECGMGQRSSLCKMVAEVLQLPLERVDISPPDTYVNPYEFGLVGSRGTYAVGAAVIRAAEDARRQMLEMASPLLGAPPDELDTANGLVFVRNQKNKRIHWRGATGLRQTITGIGRFKADFSLSNFLMTFVEIEVDTETGKIDLLNVVHATDCGQIIAPAVLDGQLHGSLGAAGLDTAIFERTILDPKTGHMLNGNMVDYKWRTFNDLPPMQNVILETPVESHRFKAVGVGEIATSPGPGAVQMAVYNAIGKRIMEYPLAPEKILEALGKT